MNFYLNKYGFLPPQIIEDPKSDLGIVVVIPCFNEPDLISSLNSLVQCKLPHASVEVIIVVNSGEHHSVEILRQNQRTIAEYKLWKDQTNSEIDFHLIHVPDLPKKHAGVGLARKIGMDEAVARFETLKKEGIIVCFDADSSCDQNYLTEIEDHFKRNPETPGCSIYFEHPIDGDEFGNEIYSGIINYELHLRYYNQALNFVGLPYAFHTVGSSMAVRSSIYQKQGGMNKRKAGEDFYFIHKIIALGGFTELNTTRVIPSPRISDRVPFGTGKAIGDWVDQGKLEYLTYNFQSFIAIKHFVDLIPVFYESTEVDLADVSTKMKEFLVDNGLYKAINEAKIHSTSYTSFLKRFFVWFDAFLVLKLVHFLRDEVYVNQPITIEVSKLFVQNSWGNTEMKVIDQLDQLRMIERSISDQD
ncbi:MAG: glycosyltransferase [Crocinitomicaceae bacterium]|nr:glycosyltransferase [Crocinitomicaceae bacterium]